MLIGLTDLKTYQAISEDGANGRLFDMLFPRGEWIVRYIVLQMDDLDRQTTVPSSCLQQLNPDNHTLEVHVNRSRMAASPDLDLTKRIERKDEQALYDNYGWPPYWLQDEQDVTPTGILSGEPERLSMFEPAEFDSTELQRVTETVGDYAVHTLEGELGVLQDVLINDRTWTITRLAVDVSEKREPVLVETDRVREIDWITKEIYVSLTKEELPEGSGNS